MIVQPLTIHPLLHIVQHLRSRDLGECLALHPQMGVVEWAHLALEAPGDSFVLAMPDGEPVGAGGFNVFEDQPGVRWTWLIGTERVGLLGSYLHRFAVRVHDAMIADGTRLFRTLCLDDGNPTAFRWLERLGYQRGESGLYGSRRVPMVTWERGV